MNKRVWRRTLISVIAVGWGAVFFSPLGCGDTASFPTGAEDAQSDVPVESAKDSAIGKSDVEPSRDGAKKGGTGDGAMAETSVTPDSSRDVSADTGPSTEAGSEKDAGSSDACVDECGFEKSACPKGEQCCMPLPGLHGCNFCAPGCPA
jgi:hypothetical protein